MKKKSLTILVVVLSIVSNIQVILADSGVQTGDGTRVMPYILLIVAAVICAGVTFWYKKKK